MQLTQQTALVLVERLVCQPKPHRETTLETFPCFHANKGLKVVREPKNEIGYYSTVHPSGYTVPKSFMWSLDNAIKFCDLATQACPELTTAGLIIKTLTSSDRKRIEAILFAIANQLEPFGFEEDL